MKRPPPERPAFETTRWSEVIATGLEDSGAARSALQALCRRYWFPLFAFARRRGHDEAHCEDLVQAFFLRVVQHNVFAVADRSRGRFRTFLLSSFENFLRNEHRKQHAQRRGGGKRIASLDAFDSTQILHQISHQCSPEAEFHRQWALAVLDTVLARLREQYQREGKSDVFENLRPYLSTDSDRKPYASIARVTGMSESNVKVAVHRLRRRYRKLLESEIALTVQSADQIGEEIQELFEALRGG